MILYQMIHLSKELEGHKELLYSLTAEKGYSDPEVMKMGEKVERLVKRYRDIFSPCCQFILINNR